MAAFSDQLNVKIRPEDRAWLKARAKAEERTISGQVRHWIQQDRARAQAEVAGKPAKETPK